MASNESDLINAILPWILGFITIIGSIIAGFKVITKYLICKGKNQENANNWKNLIEGKIDKVASDLDTFKKWAYGEHSEMNESNDRKYSELLQVITELKEAQAETNGYLKRLAEEK